MRHGLARMNTSDVSVLVSWMDARAQFPVLREPRIQLPFRGTSGPTSFSGNLGSNFLPWEFRVRLSSPQDFLGTHLGLPGNLSLHISRDVPGEATCRAFPGETFHDDYVGHTVPIALMTARSSDRQLHFTGMTYGYGELISCLGSRIRLPPYLSKLAWT